MGFILNILMQHYNFSYNSQCVNLTHLLGVQSLFLVRYIDVRIYSHACVYIIYIFIIILKLPLKIHQFSGMEIEYYVSVASQFLKLESYTTTFNRKKTKQKTSHDAQILTLVMFVIVLLKHV